MACVSMYKLLNGMQVCWAKDGDSVAACFSNRVVSVLDLRT